MAKLKGSLGVRDDLIGLGWSFEPSLAITASQLDKLGIDIRSFKEPLKRCVQQVMAPSFRKNFDAEGRPDAWEPLAEWTVEYRELKGFTGDGPILNRTGLLKRTMQQLNIWTINTTTASLQGLPDKIWYGAIHQAGYAGGGKANAIPQRQFALLQDEDFDAIEKIFEDWLDERIAHNLARISVSV